MHLFVTSGWDGREHLRMHCAITVTSSLQLETRRFPTRPLQETLPAIRKTTMETITTFSAASHSSSLSGLQGRLQVSQTHFAHQERCWRRQRLRPPLNITPVRRPREERKDSFRTPRTAATGGSRLHAVHQKSRETNKYICELTSSCHFGHNAATIVLR